MFVKNKNLSVNFRRGKMKKVLTIILSLVLTLSVALFSGCGDSSLFSGKYTEVQASELTTFAAEVDAAEGGDEIDYDGGINVYVKMDVTQTIETVTNSQSVTMDLKAIAENNELKMQGDVTNKTNGVKQTGSMYYYQDYMYMDGGVSGKYKMPIGLDDYINLNLAGAIGTGTFLSLEDLLEESIGEGETLKFYQDNSGEDTKIKVEYSAQGRGFSLVFIYNAQKKLVAYRMSAHFEEEGFSGAVVIEYKPWTGSITLPTDLNTYVQIGA